MQNMSRGAWQQRRLQYAGFQKCQKVRTQGLRSDGIVVSVRQVATMYIMYFKTERFRNKELK